MAWNHILSDIHGRGDNTKYRLMTQSNDAPQGHMGRVLGTENVNES